MTEVRGVQLQLTKAQALVLFDWVGNIESGIPAVMDGAIFSVFCDVEAQLEAIIDEAFSDDYNALVETAKAEINNAG